MLESKFCVIELLGVFVKCGWNCMKIVESVVEEFWRFFMKERIWLNVLILDCLLFKKLVILYFNEFDGDRYKDLIYIWCIILF